MNYYTYPAINPLTCNCPISIREYRQQLSNNIQVEYIGTDLERLAQVAGFLIRNIDVDWDQRIYKIEYEKVGVCEGRSRIHSYMLQHSTDNTRRYF